MTDNIQPNTVTDNVPLSNISDNIVINTTAKLQSLNAEPITSNNVTSPNAITLSLTSKIDNLSNLVDHKIDDKLQSAVSGDIAKKGNDFLNKIVSVIENGMSNFASLSQNSVDKVIRSTNLPEAVKVELIKDVNDSMVDASVVVKKDIEVLEKDGEVFLRKEFPLVETKMAGFIKDIIHKMKNFADKTITKCEDNVHKISDKIKSIVGSQKDIKDNSYDEDNNDFIYIDKEHNLDFAGLSGDAYDDHQIL